MAQICKKKKTACFASFEKRTRVFTPDESWREFEPCSQRTHVAPSKDRIGDQTAVRGAETQGDALFGQRTAVTQEVVTVKEC